MAENSDRESPSVSIIIPFRSATPYLYDCLKSLFSQKNQNFEIICIPDSEEELDVSDFRLRVIPKSGTPSAKRNYGVSVALSENIAFIDDDAIPHENWLNAGLLDLKNEKVVTGPNISPNNDGVRRLASDLFFTSVYGSLSEVYRYKPVPNKRYVGNLATVNMFIKRDVFVSIGGFSLDIWPGEDTHFSEELKKAGYRIFYDPNLIVYHHRREVFRGHIIQIWKYAKYRGASVKIGEFKPFYFVPSILLLSFLLLVVLSILFSWIIAEAVFGIILVVSLVIFVDFYLRCKSLMASVLGILTVWSSHITYGLGVLYGMLFTNLRIESNSE